MTKSMVLEEVSVARCTVYAIDRQIHFSTPAILVEVSVRTLEMAMVWQVSESQYGEFVSFLKIF